MTALAVGTALLTGCSDDGPLAQQVGGCPKNTILEPVPLPDILSSRTRSWFLVDAAEAQRDPRSLVIARAETLAVAVPRDPDVTLPDDLIERGVPQLEASLTIPPAVAERLESHPFERLLVSTRDGRTVATVGLVDGEGAVAFVGECAERGISSPLRQQTADNGQTMLETARTLIRAR